MVRNQIRQSQLVLSFGPGSMLDLPEVSVIVAGLEEWYYAPNERTLSEVVEPRLTSKLAQRFKVDGLTLRRPPRATDARQEPDSNVKAMRFPKWYVASTDERHTTGYFRRRLVHFRELENNRFMSGGEKFTVVPIRFVKACVRGHLDDVDWKWLLHGPNSDCTQPKWIEERGNTGDLTEVYVTCGCGAQVRMSDVAAEGSKRLGKCFGARPWLGPNSSEDCDETSRLLIRNATNAYFAERITVISIPAVARGAQQQVMGVVNHLDLMVAERPSLEIARRYEPLKSHLEGMTSSEVWATYDAMKDGGTVVAKSVKEEEYEALSTPKKELTSDEPFGDFFAREIDLGPDRKPWMRPIKRVVLLHRLRAVTALVGFTRFEPAGTDIQGELDVGVETASLARDLKWLPATESRGEGVFVELDAQRVATWLASKAVQERVQVLQDGFQVWLDEHAGSNRTFVGAPYILLHTLSHMLMNAIALECGYPASSLQERIYAIGKPSDGTARYGLLVYTAANDADGTLGGLVNAGRNLSRHLQRALESGMLCSNDPVCAQHDPTTRGTDHLSGAACHGCVIAPETSCEHRNEDLDRALVVPTVDSSEAAFFKDCMP